MNAEPESNTGPRGRWLAWSMWILTACLASFSILFVFLNDFASFPDPFCCSGFPSILTQIMALACSTVGVLIVSHRHGNSIGWIFVFSGFGMSLNFFALSYAVYTGVTQPGSLPFGSVMAWLASWIWVPSWWLIMTFLLLLFPDGKLPSKRWRLVAHFVVIILAANLAVRMFKPGPLTWGMPTFDNPFGIGGAFGEALRWADGKVFQLLLISVFASAVSLILRFIGATGIERQQIKWLAYAGGMTGLALAVSSGFLYGSEIVWNPWVETILFLPFLGIPISVGIAILKHRLFDIDLLINRTLVYFTLTAITAGLYVLVVGSLSNLLQNQNDLAAPAIALLIVVALVQPLRRGLQNNVNRLLRFDPSRRNESQVTLQKSSERPDEAREENVQIHIITEPDSSPSTRLVGRWLWIARLAWVAVFLTLFVMYAFGFLAAHETLSTICEAEPCTLRHQIRHTDAGEEVVRWAGPSVGFADRLRPDQVEVLDNLGLTLDQYGWLGALQMGVPALVLLLIAVGLFWRKSNDWMALFASVMVATFAVHNSPLPFTLLVLQPAWEWVHHLAGFVALSCLLIFPLLFPTGSFVPRWTRWMAFYDLAGAFIGSFLGNAILEVFGEVLGRVFIGVIVVIPFGVGVYAQLYRYFRVARPAERQQFKWVVVGLAGTLVIQFAVLIPLNALLTSPAFSADPARALVLSTVPDTLWQINNLFIAVCIVISVLRYRLWDVDIIINRSLVYGALTASVVGLYVLIVGWLSIGLQTNNLPASVFAILIIAFLFRPLHQRLQRIANRVAPMPQSTSPSEQHKHKIEISEGQGAADTTLPGHWFLIARLAWAVGFLALTAMYVFGFLAVRDALSTVCEEELCTLRQQIRHTDTGKQVVGWPGPPIGYADRLRSDQIESLRRLSLSPDQYGWLGALQMGIPALVYLLIAAGLFWQKSDNWMVLFVSVMVATFPLQDMPLPFTLAVRQPAWEWAFDLASIVALSSFLIFPLIFPTGRFVPRWTRWMVLFVLSGAVIAMLFRNSILKIPGADILVVVYLLISFGTGVYAQLYRYFRVASPVERQQLKWVIVGLAGFIGTALVLLFPLEALLVSLDVRADPAQALILSAIPDTLFRGISLFIPVSITISVLRYRLWDIDIIINRTLVYGALTGTIVGAFVVIVGSLSTILQSSGNSIIAIVATGLVALLFNPLRQRLQRWVNHLMYGERDDPYAALSRLGRRLESSLAPEAVLPTVVTTVRDVLRLPYVAIYLQKDSHGYEIVAESASPLLRIENGRIRIPGMEREGRCIPLIHQGETVGYIVLGPRASNEAFSTTDLRLLEDLAPQVGVAVHAVRLTADLQRSREQLVLAREEERRRLRRDLHDGLGPQLAGLALKLETLRNRLRDDPLADSLLADLAKRTQDATADIRRLVYELRPPTLDELGLVSALREGASQYSQQGLNGVHITIDAPDNLPPLPAAVEVAVYRIAQEALTNVIRHADARACLIRLTLDKAAGILCLEVQDDGRGLLMKRRAGVGLNSMRERAEELGGTWTIESIPAGGTHISVRLPYSLSDEPASSTSKQE